MKSRLDLQYPADIVKKKLKNQFVITIVHVQTDNWYNKNFAFYSSNCEDDKIDIE